MGESELVVRFAAGEPGGVAEIYRANWPAGVRGDLPGARRRHPGRGRHPANVQAWRLAAEQICDAWLVRGALDSWSVQDREQIRLLHDGKLTQNEISDQLAIPLESVKTRSHRAHGRFSRLLAHLRDDREDVTPTAAQTMSELRR